MTIVIDKVDRFLIVYYIFLIASLVVVSVMNGGSLMDVSHILLIFLGIPIVIFLLGYWMAIGLVCSNCGNTHRVFGMFGMGFDRRGDNRLSCARCGTIVNLDGEEVD